MVVTFWIRFLFHRDLFNADFWGFWRLIGTVGGGFQNWLFYEVPAHVATLTVGLLAFSIGILGWIQKRNSDMKAEWWRRTQYGMNLALTGEEQEIIAGSQILAHLGEEQAKSPFLSRRRKKIADDDDLRLLKRFTKSLRDPEASDGTMKQREPIGEEDT